MIQKCLSHEFGFVGHKRTYFFINVDIFWDKIYTNINWVEYFILHDSSKAEEKYLQF